MKSILRRTPALAAAFLFPFLLGAQQDAPIQLLAPPDENPGRATDRTIPPGEPPPSRLRASPLASAFTNLPGTWVPQGPSPISGGQVEGMTNRFVCGAIHAVLAHPTDPNILYIGALNGGVWKTTNATAANPTWTTTTSSLTSLSVSALAFDIQDATSNTIWAGLGRYSSWYRIGGSRSGLIRSTDGGATWQLVTGGGVLTGKNVSGLVVRGSTILVSVNSVDSGGNPQAGVWRSINGGTSFTQMAVGNGTTTGLPEGVAYDIASSPSSPNTVYTSIALPTTATAKGIFRSTDLGATWTRISNAAQEAQITSSTSNIELSAGNADNVFVGIIRAGALVGIWNSADSGTSWSQMDLPTMPVSTATTATVTNATNASPIVITTAAAHGLSTNQFVQVSGVTGNTAANGIFQITVQSTTTFALEFSTGNGAYVSGGTAVRVVSANPRGQKGPDAEAGTPEDIAGGQGAIHFSILADPTSPNLVYIGGDRQDLPFPNYISAIDYSGALWRGDASAVPNNASPSSQWKHLTHSNSVAGIPGGGTTNNSSPHADSRDMTIDAAGNMIQVDDGGVFKRTNPQTNAGAWTSLAGNLQIAEVHSIAYDTVSNIIITGNQDNGTTEQTSANSLGYRAVSTGDGGDVAVSVNPANPAQSIRYSSFQNLTAGQFRRRVMSNANAVVSQTFPALSPQGGAPAIIGQFTTPVVINSVDANRLIIGASNGLYESTDQGSTVSRVTTLAPTDANVGGRTMIYGGRKNGTNNAEVVYFARSNTILRRTVAGGTPATVAGYAGGTVRGIITDPEDFDHLIAIDNDQVFRSVNGGANFTDITGDLPATAKDFRSVEFIGSGNAAALVLGTLRGVYVARLTAPTDWATLGADFPNTYVWDMDYDPADDVLVVGTLGRGVFRFDNISAVLPPTVTSLTRAGSSPTNAASVAWTLTFSAPVTGVTAANFALSGPPATGATIGAPSTANGGLTWNVPVTPGSTDGVLTLSLANTTGHEPVVSTALPFAGQSYTLDRTGPSLNLPAPITVTATSPAGAVVTYAFTPTDPVGVASASAAPASGSTFAIGTTTVNATATDTLGNVSNGSFTVTVDPNPPPTGGTLVITPAANVYPGDPLVLSTAGWSDPDTPLTYQFFLGTTALNAAGASSSLNTVAPAAGAHTFKVRVTDAAGSFAEATQTLTVLMPNTALLDWRQLYFGTSANSGSAADDADPDGDGLVNAAEFGFGTHPTADSSGVPALRFTGTFAAATLVATGQPISLAEGLDQRLLFIRRTSPATAGLSYLVEFGPDLDSWTASTATPVVLATSGDYELVSVPFPAPVVGQTSRFGRVTVELAP